MSFSALSRLFALIRPTPFAFYHSSRKLTVDLEGKKANVTVMTENDALTAAEVTRIRDALLSQCEGLAAQDITIVEVK